MTEGSASLASLFQIAGVRSRNKGAYKTHELERKYLNAKLKHVSRGVGSKKDTLRRFRPYYVVVWNRKAAWGPGYPVSVAGEHQ